MLADWYVCCCIGLNPDQTTAFLAILDALETPTDDDQIAVYAIQELQKTDIWLQAYAFHKVLKYLRPKNNSTNALPIIKEYFSGILEFIPEEIQDYYQALFPKIINSVIAKDSALNLLDQIALCANQAENLSARNPTPVPYLDLKEFLPETILLSTIYERLVTDNTIRFALATRLESDQNFHSLYRIFEKAQKGEFGRLAFQLSIQIDAKLPSRYFSREELFRTLSRSFSTINYEPDLLQAYAKILFIGDQVDETLIEKKSEIVNKIVNEIANLSELRNLQKNVVKPESNNDPLERIGLPATSKRLMVNLPIIYWQSTLWELIADYDPVLAGNTLAKNWEIPSNNLSEIVVSTKLQSNESSDWKYQLNSLLILRGLNGKTIIKMRKDSGQEIQPSSSWIFLSPWFRLSNEDEKSRNKYLQYPEVEKHDALIRLLSAVLVSTKILQALGSQNDNSASFASFIAHASDVLNYYRFWLRNYANPEKNEIDHKIPLQLTGLTLFGIRQINLVGRGLIPSVAPNIFLDLLKRKEEIINSNSSNDVKKFFNVNLPEVLMYWIADAYPGVVDSNGPGRWLELIPEIYWFYRQGGHDFHNRVAAALVVRYLTPDFKLKIDRDLNWQTSNHVQDQKSWNLNHRLLLLSERGLSPTEWHMSEWEEPDWNNPKSNKQSQLVRAIERLISAKLSGTNFTGLEGWHLDWVAQLNSISRTTDLDRFTRLRLIELIGEPVIRDLTDDIILVANIVLEYGCAYDLSLLIEKVFCFNQNPLNINDESWQILQSTFLQSLYAEYKKLKTDDSENNYQSIQDPRIYRINRQRLNIIERTLIKIAYWGLIARSQGIQYSLADELCNIQVQSKSKLVDVNLRSTKATFEVRGKTKRIILEDNSVSIGEWNVRAAIVNPNVQTANLFYEDLDDDGLINWFSLPERDVFTILNGQNRTPIQVVATVVTIKELENSRAKIVFNCGINFYLEMVFRTPLEYSIGDFVSLKIYKGGDDFRWQVARDSSPKKLKPRIRIGDFGLVAITGLWYEGKRTLSLSRNNSSLQFDKAVWEPDISGVYYEADGSLQRDVYARYDGENSWSPVDHDFLDFLFQAIEPGSQIAILTIIEKVELPNNQFAWRVSRTPGENYLIPDEHFVPEDLNQLNNYAQKFANPKGLLIALKPDIIDNQIYLKLFSDDNIPTYINEKYPYLKVPFDNRNIAWRNLFNTSMIAERNGSNWFVVLDNEDQIPGFPRKILVQWDRYRPSGGLQRAEFTSTLWGDDEARTATVYGDALYTNKIKPRDGRWNEFADKWLSINTGTQLTIVRTIGNIQNDGMILCLTDENILVKAEAETISFLTFSSQTKISIDDFGRDVEIFWMRWNLSRKSIKFNQFPLPENLSGHKEVVGVFIEVPIRAAADASLCKVLWKNGEEVIHGEVLIENLSELNINPGSLLVASKEQDSQWVFTIKNPSILVRALWKIQAWAGQKDNLHYIGYAPINGSRVSLVEAEPGLVFTLPLTKDIRYLSLWNGAEFKGGLHLDVKTTNLAQDQIWNEGRRTLQRASINISGKLLCGFCESASPKKEIYISDISLFSSKSKQNTDRYVIRRELKLSSFVALEQKEPVEQKTKDNNAEWIKKFQHYLDAPYDLVATFNNDQIVLKDIKIPSNDGSNTWTNTVVIGKNEGTFLVEPSYSVNAFVRVFETANDTYAASFRQVPPYSPEEFRQLLGAGYNEPFRLESQLYYVGQEEFDPITGNQYGEVAHRFEWGYGKTLLIPESQLLYNGDLFRSAQMILFFGDSISGLTFYQNRTATSNQDVNYEINQCAIEINDFNIQFSRARSLFSQRSEYKILHVLRIVVIASQLEIVDVEGFDESRLLSEKKSFENTHAKLSSESYSRLSNRYLKENNVGLSDSPYLFVLGRLDEDEFRRSLGRNLVFEHVKFSLNSSKDTSTIRDNELVFMQASDIIRLKNDFAILISPPQKMDERDIGDDFTNSILLLRRHFSIRENLLGKIYKEKGRGGLKDTLLLVRVAKRDSKVFASIRFNMPSRKKQALATAIANNNQPFFAAVDEIKYKSLSVEAKPGIFVNISSEDIESWPIELARGDIVRLGISPGGKFQVARAIFSDTRYIPINATRLAVTLPKNTLLDKKTWQDQDINKVQFWEEKKIFTLGGFPGIEAIGGSYDSNLNQWSSGRTRDFVDLMKTIHPKIVQVGQDNKNQFRVGIPSDTSSYGGLILNSDNKFLYQNLSSGERELLDWNTISFGDQSKNEIIIRLKRDKWQYHDEKTGTWSEQGTDIVVVEHDLGLHNAESGPLFFEVRGSKKRLRYTKKNLINFGYTGNELIYSLRRTKKNRLPLVGINNDESLWLEISPGRIVEVPVQLLNWSLGKTEIPLSSFSLQMFSMGDLIDVEITIGDDFSIDHINIFNWIPGPRNSFGPQKCILPIESYDEKEGYTLLGAGDFTLKVPSVYSEANLLCVDPENNIETSFDVKRGDTILLGLDEAGRPSVLGYSNFVPRPEQGNVKVWENDVLAHDLLTTNSYGTFEFDLKKVTSLIKAAGGALPMTVEGVSEKGFMFLSRRHQIAVSGVAINKIFVGYMLGLLSDGKTAIIRCGGNILKVDFEEIISGLPKKSIKIAESILIKNKVQIWLRTNENGDVITGVKDERSKNISIEALSVLTPEQHHDSNGIICQSVESGKLYWLPEKLTSWTYLSANELNQIFSGRKDFKARIVKKDEKYPILSIVDLADIKKEFSNLQIGSKTSVKVLSLRTMQTDSHLHFLVELPTTQTIFDCIIYDNQYDLQPGDFIPVEVVGKVVSVPILVTVVPTGKRRFVLDLPNWMQQTWPNPRKLRDRFSNFLLWYSSDATDIEHDINLDILNDVDVDQMLCKAYKHIGTNDKRLREFQMRIVEEWYSRNKFKSEIDVTYNLMAILVFYYRSLDNAVDIAAILNLSVDDASRLLLNWKKTAAFLSRELGRRAIRCLHVEVLSQDWIFNPNNRLRLDGLWNRLSQLQEILNKPIDIESIDRIVKFGAAVNQWNVRDLQPISDSLVVSTGSRLKVDGIVGRAQILGKLIDIYRTMPTTESNLYPPLHKTHAEKLKNVLDIIVSQAIDLSLLDPLPKIDRQEA